ncbi:MAG: hypothetical protein HS116_20085 [Planctomycetes bacterium]|nr:hypothetical protein [Planctomycetota bacterium]
MSESVGSGGGAGAGPSMPRTFGEKLSYFASLVALNLALTSLICFVLVWIVSGNLSDKLEEANEKAKTNETEWRQRLSDAEKVNTDQNKANDELKQNVVTLTSEKEAIKGSLTQLSEQQAKVQESTAKVANELEAMVNDQKKVDTNQNENIESVTRRMNYVEDKLKKLDVMEGDVMALKTDTGNLKGEYLVLKKDLTAVREKGDLTEGELKDLTERSRLFQLRVLQARAREAAEAARQGDIKKLLARLNDQ